MSSFSLKLYGTEMQHYGEQVEELEASKFKKAISENFLGISSFGKTKSCPCPCPEETWGITHS